MPLHIDESGYPLVVIELRDRLTNEDVQTFMDSGARWIGRAQPYALVLVPCQMSLPGIPQIKSLVRWMNENAEGLDTYHKVFAVVTDSPMMRGGLKAIFKLRRLFADQLVTESVEDAVAWAGQQLERHRA